MLSDFSSEDKIIISNLQNRDQLFQVLEKQWIEIQNGIDYSYVLIQKSIFQLNEIKKIVKSLFENSNFNWKIHYHINETKSHIEIFSFLNHNEYYLNNLKNDYNYYLNSLSNNLYIKESISSEINSIENQCFSAPRFISYQNNSIVSNVMSISYDRDLFESKIDVNSYNFFESVHPAYAYQMLRIYDFLYKNNINASHFIDIGAGPGAALQMLIELLPSYSKIDVIEPSPTAFGYLKERFKNNSFINPIQKGFFDYHPDEPCKLAISVGSSHHFNTYFLFQHARKILSKDGYLIISDEFISPFSNRRERTKNIISHHIRYIFDLIKLGNQNNEFVSSCNDDEYELLRVSHSVYPRIKLEILAGNIENAEKMCRDLLERISIIVDNNLNISNSFLSYYRLSFLELQALVAGIDYDVECKTYVENLIKMAESQGFSLEHHEKIYTTTSGGNFNSGTHLVCFKKI